MPPKRDNRQVYLSFTMLATIHKRPSSLSINHRFESQPVQTHSFHNTCITVASTFLTCSVLTLHYFLLCCWTFLAFPLRFFVGIFSTFFLTAAAIAFLPPFALGLGLLGYLDIWDLPSPFLLSPHFPMRSPFVL